MRGHVRRGFEGGPIDRASGRNWAARVEEEHGRAALTATCKGSRILLVGRGNPARVWFHPAHRDEPTGLRLDDDGLTVTDAAASGWPAEGHRVDGVHVACRAHRGHPIDAARLVEAWHRVDLGMPTARVLDVRSLAPR